MAAVFSKNIWYGLHVMGNNGVFQSAGSGVPTNGTSGTGANKAGPGSLYIDYTNATIYQNTGTLASPTWTLLSAGGGTLTPTSVTASGLIKSTGAMAGVGYATGAGAAVTQATNRTTGVTINAVCGAITLVSAAGSATPASFTVTNSAVAATDVIYVCQKSGTDKYEVFVTAVAAGSFQITSFTTGGTTTEQPVFNFAVIKAVAA
jgi:hypothetical protein